MPEVYSLLKEHEDVVVYRVPDPLERTHAFVEVGLFPWKLEGVNVGEAFTTALTEDAPQPEPESWEGVGMRLNFVAPTRHHPVPDDPLDALKERFPMKSHGWRHNRGHEYRIMEATPDELREAARDTIHYVFCYWWSLDQYDDFTPGLARDEKPSERKNRLDIVQRVTGDGTVIHNDGSTSPAPYTLDEYTFHLADDWESPSERCTAAFNDLIDDLVTEYPEQAVKKGYRQADSDDILTPRESTEERKQARQYERALQEVTSEADGIGRKLRYSIKNEFDSIEDLCEDIRTGADRLHDVHYLGESIEDALVDALIETGRWVPVDDE